MKLFIVCPTYDGRLEMGTHNALLNAVMTGIPQKHGVTLGSLITQQFNYLWCTALGLKKEEGITHFLMIHADVVPIQVEWLQPFLEEFTKTKADVLSVVMPIKSPAGDTSTAVDTTKPGQSWNHKNLTMKDVMSMPATFDAEEAYRAVLPDWDGPKTLLVNTGLMLVDFTKPWVDDFYFTMRDERVIQNGKPVSRCEPEDWNMSRRLAVQGLKVMATRKVEAEHVGRAQYPNYCVWGNK